MACYSTKKPMLAANMMNVAAQPPTSMGRGTVSRPMMRPLPAISMITVMTGTAKTPLMTALQYNAFTGSSRSYSRHGCDSLAGVAYAADSVYGLGVETDPFT
jgi:hypothetical protein